MLIRIISGAVGVVLLIGILFFHDTIVLPIAVGAIIAVMLYELLRAVQLHKCIPVLLAVEAYGIAVPFIYNKFYWYPDVIGGADLPQTDGKVTLWAFATALLAVFVIFLTWLRNHKTIRYEQIFFALAVMVLVPQAMSCMVRIDRCSNDGLFLLVMGLCGAWIADTGAYFTGVAFGKHKLCPEISPKKTIEGFIGGLLITGLVYSASFCIYKGEDFKIAIFAFVLGVICAIIGTIGDLSASMVKRQIGFKDYGKIMPGHGGLMDRFDSVLFVLPTFYAFISLTEIF
ncbi:MAG: phosphatidate cytidylyltransferase [Ruminococcus sp.]|nr:phosphatidate cytidylyltransferase [Ruminococcus sp.]